MQKVFDEFQPQIVFHLAAQPIVRASYDDPKGTFDTNVGGTVNVMECVRHTRSIEVAVFIATDKCYENREWEFGYREVDPLGGKDPYSASKAAAELVFKAYQLSFFSNGQSKVRIGSARAGNVIGGGDWAADRIVPDCVRHWSNGNPVCVRNPGSTRPWQHVLEPLSGYLWLGAHLWQSSEGVVGESFNFGPQDDASQTVSRLIEEMEKTWIKARWEHDPAGTGNKKEAGLLWLNCDRALSRLRWKACLSFEQTVRMTVEWYKDYYAGSTTISDKTAAQIREYEQIALHAGRTWAGAEA
jgi:CDP-glucose 4,6-dehydratase